MEKLVSIVVPIYNQEKYLHRAMDSILSQSYRNIEVVAVDDGSTDSSADILSLYKSGDDRIRIVSKENGGLVDAVCAGIAASHGDYICFVDSDDYIGEDFIMNFILAIDNNDFISMGYYKDINGKIIMEKLRENKTYSGDELKGLSTSFLVNSHSSSISNEIFISRWNKMYKRNCINNILPKYFECKDISLGEDSIFTYLMIKECTSGKAVSAPNSYYYNIRSDNSMCIHTPAEKHLEASKRAFYGLKTLMEKNGDNDNSAYYLLFFLVENLFQKEKNGSKEQFDFLYHKLHSDTDYQETLKILAGASTGKKKVALNARRIIASPGLFRLISKLSRSCKFA